ncbi:MAG: FGGY family carbohydrate kinase [Actinomycetota bacterium]|nr:FGGY family carbohydrate kinase [Actinomycetota bacterium]
MGQQVIVGVDVGTTSIKALAVTPAGEILGEASAATPWRHQGAWADADAHELADVAIDVCARAAAEAGQVMAIGVTSIAEAGALIDRQGEPCAPILAWFDPRGDAASVRAVVDPRDYQRATGRRLNSKPSLMKIMWLRANVESARAAVRHLCVAEWIVRALGGDEVSEASLSSRTGMLDVTARAPWAGAVELVGDLLPSQRVWAGDPAGIARGERVPSILRGATLTVAGLDHQAAVLISGAAHDGALFDSMGTAEALIRTVAQPRTLDDIEWLTDRDIDVDWSVRPHHQILLAGRLTGLTLERVAAMLGATDRETRRALAESALSVSRGPDAPVLADVSNDAISLSGITDGVTPGLVWRSVVEDLTRMSSEALEQMSHVVGPATSTVLGGGWTRNPMVAAAKREQLGDPTFVDIAEPGALGAAFLGGVAAEVCDRPGDDGVPRWPSSA